MTGGGHGVTRRGFLAGAGRGIVGGAVMLGLPRWLGAQSTQPAPARVAFTHGDSRTANIFEALRRIEADVRRSLAKKKRVLIKPNVVSTTIPLTATHVDCLEGILEFLRPLVKDEIIIAESSASGPATEGFDNYGYLRLQKKYNVRFVDLDGEPVVIKHMIDERYRPQPVRVSRMLLDPDLYVISPVRMKTHDRAVVTLSLKNLAVGAVIKDMTYRWRNDSRGKNDKWLVHGGRANEAINYNLFALARMLRPDLSVIDGFQGMEHNGPIQGTPVDHKVAVASTNWLAADRTAVELMGFEFAKIGYLSFCAKAGMGESDLRRIDVLGGRLADYVRKYRPHDKIEEQYKWMAG
jgi:uncharacterized protein (DUF362 family)